MFAATWGNVPAGARRNAEWAACLKQRATISPETKRVMQRDRVMGEEGRAVPRAMLEINGKRHLLKIKGRYLIYSEKM